MAQSSLFRAWGSATTPVRQYLVAQHLVLVYALLGDREAVAKWLTESRNSLRAEINSHLGDVPATLWQAQLLGKPKESERKIFPVSAAGSHDPADFMRFEGWCEGGFGLNRHEAKPSRLRFGGRHSKPPPTHIEGLVFRVWDQSVEGVLSGLAQLDNLGCPTSLQRDGSATASSRAVQVAGRRTTDLTKGARILGRLLCSVAASRLRVAAPTRSAALCAQARADDLTIGYQWDAKVSGRWDEQDAWEMGRTEIVDGVQCYIG